MNDLLNVGRGVLTQITIAPELAGAQSAIRQRVDGGVIAAVGHAVASQEVARIAFEPGTTAFTHALNAARGIRHREPGPIMAAADDERVTLELMLDGVHVAPIVALTPFQAALGLDDRLGYLAAGFAADFVGLTANLTVSQVWADGAQIAPRAAAPS